MERHDDEMAPDERPIDHRVVIQQLEDATTLTASLLEDMRHALEDNVSSTHLAAARLIEGALDAARDSEISILAARERLEELRDVWAAGGYCSHHTLEEILKSF